MTDVVLLVHGGIYGETDARSFWGNPGVLDGLAAAGVQALAPDRPPRPSTWTVEGDALARDLLAANAAPAAVVAGSNGCSAALRLALDHAGLVSHLVLAWPATAGLPESDARARAAIDAVADAGTADRLLAGNTIRGVADGELRRLEAPVTVIPADPPDPYHQPQTVAALDRLVPGCTITAGMPPPPAPGFDPGAFVAAVTGVLEP